MPLLEEAILAIDLGATSFRVAVVDRRGNIASRHRADTNTHEGQQRVLARLSEAGRLVMDQAPNRRVVAVSVAAPGTVDPTQGVLITPPNLPNWRNVPLKKVMEGEFGMPVLVNNDATLAALGEHQFGAGRGRKHMVYLTWSTGIGGGGIVDGALLLGAKGLAGEPGHMIMEPEGPLCGCGNRGCLESVASGTAIARMAQEALARGEASLIASLTKGQSSSITAEVVAQAARSGDALAQSLLRKASTYMGIGVVNLIHLLDPERVIIGGGISRIGGWFGVRCGG